MIVIEIYDTETNKKIKSLIDSFELDRIYDREDYLEYAAKKTVKNFLKNK